MNPRELWSLLLDVAYVARCLLCGARHQDGCLWVERDEAAT